MAARRRIAALASAVALVVAATVAVAWSRGEVLMVEGCVASVDGASANLAVDQAANAATIAAVAVRRDLPARAATIAIATAIQESKLRNVDYGDRDSLGLFQQRPSQGWGTPAQVMDPIHATNAFYDALVRIEGYRDMEITQASHRVQRSAFPDAVADHELEGRAFASALTGWSPAALTCRLRPAEEAGDAGAVARLLQRDLGDVDAVGEGPVLRVGVGDDDRRAWAVAHWAVAHAAALDVVRVVADGRQWRRDDPDAGWTPAPDGGPGVMIEVAAS